MQTLWERHRTWKQKRWWIKDRIEVKQQQKNATLILLPLPTEKPCIRILNTLNTVWCQTHARIRQTLRFFVSSVAWFSIEFYGDNDNNAWLNGWEVEHETTASEWQTNAHAIPEIRVQKIERKKPTQESERHSDVVIFYRHVHAFNRPRTISHTSALNFIDTQANVLPCVCVWKKFTGSYIKRKYQTHIFLSLSHSLTPEYRLISFDLSESISNGYLNLVWLLSHRTSIFPLLRTKKYFMSNECIEINVLIHSRSKGHVPYQLIGPWYCKSVSLQSTYMNG